MVLVRLSLNFDADQFFLPCNSTVNKNFSICLGLKQEIFKTVLKALAYETINSCYLEEEWLQVFTDGSRLRDSTNASDGVHCELFLYTHPSAHLQVPLKVKQRPSTEPCYNYKFIQIFFKSGFLIRLQSHLSRYWLPE